MKQYIDKSALLAEIERIENELKYEIFTDEFLGKRWFCKHIKSFLDALEAKEADLENEIEEVKHNYKVDNNRHTSICSADIEWLANHFFELGLKVQKGE